MELKHSCKWPTCHRLVNIDERYCSMHQQKGEQLDLKRQSKYEHNYNQVRYEKNPLTKNYHSTEWKKLRESVLARDNHLCQECLKKGLITQASHVDHIQSAISRPDLFWDMNNLQSLCASCHTRKTIEEQRDKKKAGKNMGRKI